jgi:hypothetical protein
MTAITDRYQFPLYLDRAAYKAASGVDAPPFNPLYPIKQWFDPAGGTSFDVLNGSDTAPALVPLAMPSAEASTVNLPGAASFPAYVIAPTSATQQLTIAGHVFPATAIDPSTLSTLDQANALAKVCGGTVVDQDATPSQFFVVVWSGETRRRFKIQFTSGPGTPADPNRTSYVGQIIQSLNAKGVGAPYHWSASQLAVGLLQPVFEFVADGSGVTAKVPIPIKLQAGEAVKSVMVGPGIFTVVVDQAGAMPPSGVGGSGVGFTDDDRLKLNAIYKVVSGA